MFRERSFAEVYRRLFPLLSLDLSFESAMNLEGARDIVQRMPKVKRIRLFEMLAIASVNTGVNVLESQTNLIYEYLCEINSFEDFDFSLETLYDHMTSLLGHLTKGIYNFM